MIAADVASAEAGAAETAGPSDELARVAELMRSLPDDERLIDRALVLLAQIRGRLERTASAEAIERVAEREDALRDCRARHGMVTGAEIDALVRCCGIDRPVERARGAGAAAPGRQGDFNEHGAESRRNKMDSRDVPSPAEPQGGIQKFLTFRLGEESYGVEIERVQEIKGYSTVTPLPNCPSYVRGVLNLRGVIVPVVDLRKRFGMVDVDYTNRNAIIVLVTQGRLAGLLVDDVSDVLDVPRGDVHAPPIGVGSAANFVRGLARVGDGLMIQVDVEKVIAVGDEN